QVAQRPVLPEPRDRAVDQPGVVGQQRVEPQPQALHDAGPEVLDHHLRALHQAAEHRLALLLLQVDGDTTLACVLRPEPCGRARTDAPMPRRLSSGSAPSWRARSPVPRASTLMTSAPRWASWWQANGPASTLVRSRTRTPCKGRYAIVAVSPL